MECPKCGTWNPDDKTKCWRCGAELPRPTEPRKSRKISSQTWLWVIAILFSLLTLLAQCGFFGGGSGDGTGFVPSESESIPLPSIGRLGLCDRRMVYEELSGSGLLRSTGLRSCEALRVSVGSSTMGPTVIGNLAL